MHQCGTCSCRAQFALRRRFSADGTKVVYNSRDASATEQSVGAT